MKLSISEGILFSRLFNVSVLFITYVANSTSLSWLRYFIILVPGLNFNVVFNYENDFFFFLARRDPRRRKRLLLFETKCISLEKCHWQKHIYHTAGQISSTNGHSADGARQLRLFLGRSSGEWGVRDGRCHAFQRPTSFCLTLLH